MSASQSCEQSLRCASIGDSAAALAAKRTAGRVWRSESPPGTLAPSLQGPTHRGQQNLPDVEGCSEQAGSFLGLTQKRS